MVHLFGPGDRAVNELAARQDGVVVADQVQRCGLGRSAVAARERSGAWQRLHRGVHVVGTAAPTERAVIFAAVAAGGISVVAAAWTVLWLHGLTPRLRRPLDLAVIGRTNAVAPRGAVCSRPQYLTWPLVRWQRGIPCTDATEAVIAVSADTHPDELATVAALAIRRRLTSGDRLRSRLDGARRPGAPRLRGVLDELAAIRSPHEHRLIALTRRAQLPEPQANVVVLGKELDLYWHDARLGIEVDAFSTHGTPSQFEDDHTVDADLEAAGVRVLRFTARRIADQPEAVVARIAAVLALRLGGLPPPRRR